MIKPTSMDKTLWFGSRLSERKVLETPYLHYTQCDPSLVLRLLCLSKECLLKLLIFCLMSHFIYLQGRIVYCFNKNKNLIRKEDKEKVFVIVLAKVLQLYST